MLYYTLYYIITTVVLMIVKNNEAYYVQFLNQEIILRIRILNECYGYIPFIMSSNFQRFK